MKLLKIMMKILTPCKDEALITKAIDLIKSTNKHTSFLQRNFQIGYRKAELWKPSNKEEWYHNQIILEREILINT